MNENEKILSKLKQIHWALLSIAGMIGLKFFILPDFYFESISLAQDEMIYGLLGVIAVIGVILWWRA